MEIQEFYDTRTATLTYVVYDPSSCDAVVIDPVLDYDPAASRVWTESAERVVAFVRGNALRLHLILETHAHADHLSGSQVVKRAFPSARLAVLDRITAVQELFKDVFDLPADFPTDGRQFDRLLRDGERVDAGTLSFEVIATPGHTPACATFRFEDALFTGDALFMPDSGTGRCDFPGGSARDLYHSVTRRLYTLPDASRVFVGHDYQPDDRPLAFQTTIAAEKAGNVQLSADVAEADFVARREARDKTLDAPRLLFQSVQVNVDAGALPRAQANEVRYLKVPINVFRPEHEGELTLLDL